jgi:superfamily I DNA/RNA helicase
MVKLRLNMLEVIGKSPAEFYRKVIADVWEKYEKTLIKEKSADFDDLLLKTMLLFVIIPKSERVSIHLAVSSHR